MLWRTLTLCAWIFTCCGQALSRIAATEFNNCRWHNIIIPYYEKQRYFPRRNSFCFYSISFKLYILYKCIYCAWRFFDDILPRGIVLFVILVILCLVSMLLFLLIGFPFKWMANNQIHITVSLLSLSGNVRNIL